MKPPRNYGNYEVGYGKTPAKSRFRPGQSGNPKGRPRANDAQTLMEAILNDLKREVTVKEDGKSFRMSLRGIISRKLVTEAAKGHLPTVRLLTTLVNSMPPGIENEETLARKKKLAERLMDLMDERDRETMAEYMKNNPE